MATILDVYRVVDSLETECVAENYALVGTMAGLFYAEPTGSYDLLVGLCSAPNEKFLLWQERHRLETRDDFVLVHNVPVRFVVATNPLQEQAVRLCNVLDYEGVQVRILTAEHLIALDLQERKSRWGYCLSYFPEQKVDAPQLKEILEQNGLASKWRVWQEEHLETPDAVRYAAKRRWHNMMARMPVERKMHFFLSFQPHHLAYLSRLRELKWWEKPWDIEP